MTDKEFAASRQIVLTLFARSMHDGGAEKAQLLRLFPPPADEWGAVVEDVYAEPAGAGPSVGRGYVPRDPGQLRVRIVEGMDAILDHPVIVGRDGLDLARCLKSYFLRVPESVLEEVAKYA